MKNNFICLDCHCQFEITRKHEVSDHTGFAGIIIDVCPVCISNHIEETEGLFLPVLDAEDITGIERMANSHIHRCIDHKLHVLNEPILLEHYSALIKQANDIVKKIRDAKK
jgi:hypothetical protein